MKNKEKLAKIQRKSVINYTAGQNSQSNLNTAGSQKDKYVITSKRPNQRRRLLYVVTEKSTVAEEVNRQLEHKTQTIEFSDEFQLEITEIEIHQRS